MASNNNNNNDDEQQVEGVDEVVSPEAQNRMMASNNNNTRKKQKRTTTTAGIIDGDYDVYSSSSTPDYLDVTLLTCTTALSFGNILQHFPELLLYVLPYIADRIAWFSIAASHKDLYEKSKLFLPPWPMNYRFRDTQGCSSPSWSPCGTRIACGKWNFTDIVVYDQRYGPFRINANNNRGCITDLEFSPDGRFLVSAGGGGQAGGFVRLWDNVTGNYEQLQEWNIKEQEGIIYNISHMNVSVSPCSKHIIVLVVTRTRNHVFLKDVNNRGKTIRSLTPEPNIGRLCKIMFSVDGRAAFVCGWDTTCLFINVWRPYLDDADDINLITIWSQDHTHSSDACYYDNNTAKYIISHDGTTTMIAIHDKYSNEGWLLSIGNNHNCRLTQKVNFLGKVKLLLSLLHFTPDNKYIVYSTIDGLKYWSVAESKFTDTEYFLYNNGKNMKNLGLANYSPNNRQLIVRETNSQPTHNDHFYYVTSFF